MAFQFRTVAKNMQYIRTSLRNFQPSINILNLPGGTKRESNAFDRPNQLLASELLAISFSLCCLARACSASIFSLITASGMELENPKPDQTLFGVLGSPRNRKCYSPRGLIRPENW